ncbi:TerB family tellurite resistance protein [bacterium]|nr:TerB family tellurite resistance protein [bacterium]
MEFKAIASMSDEVKEWFARAIVGMILADGRIDQAELDYLKGIISFLENTDLIDSILELTGRNAIPELDPIDIDEKQALFIIEHLASISIVDENLDRNEEKFLRYAAAKLHLAPEIPDKYLANALKRLKTKKKRARLTINGVTQNITIIQISENHCLFFSGKAIAPFTPLTVQLNKEKKEKQGENFFHPIEAEVIWCRTKRTIMGKFLAKADFRECIQEDHGLIFS